MPPVTRKIKCIGRMRLIKVYILGSKGEIEAKVHVKRKFRQAALVNNRHREMCWS